MGVNNAEEEKRETTINERIECGKGKEDTNVVDEREDERTREERRHERGAREKRREEEDVSEK